MTYYESTIRICKYFKFAFTVQFPKMVKTMTHVVQAFINEFVEFWLSLIPTYNA